MVDNLRKPALFVDPETKVDQEFPHQEALTQAIKRLDADLATIAGVRRGRAAAIKRWWNDRA
jgi:hypothetical protein